VARWRRDLSPHDQLALLQRHRARLEHEVNRLGAGPWALNLVDTGLKEFRLRD
jgi:hypothetical protein